MRSPTTGVSGNSGTVPGDDGTTSSKRPGLDPFTQKELANLLEENGGIKAFIDAPDHRLSKLLNEDQDTFGKKGSTLRTHIGQHYSRWIQYYKKGQCTEKALTRFQLQTSAQRKKDVVKTPKSKSLDPDDVSSVSSSSSGSVASSRKVASKSSKAKNKSKCSKAQTPKKPPAEVVLEEKPKFEKKPKSTVVSPAKVHSHQPKSINKAKMPGAGEQWSF